jgi:hypothetical protein
MKIFAPNGDNLFTVKASYEKSVISAFYQIPEDQAGGNTFYSNSIKKIRRLQNPIRLSLRRRVTSFFHSFYNLIRFTSSEREFNIRAFRAPRLKTQLKFLQKGYGAGDKAVASVFPLHFPSHSLARSNPRRRRSPNRRLDNRYRHGRWQRSLSVTQSHPPISYRSSPVSLDKSGNCLITFDLPKTITTGEGTLVCRIQDGGVVETASKTIPILLQTMEVNIYPEGGDLVGGVPCRFYVEAFTRTKDPADITGMENSWKILRIV